MASSVIGGPPGGGSGQAKPDPTQLDTFLSEIESTITTINKQGILYPEIHEAGKKLHETRANYIKFSENLNALYIKPPEGSPLDLAAGAIANVPGVGNIMANVQRFAFKFLDLYLTSLQFLLFNIYYFNEVNIGYILYYSPVIIFIFVLDHNII